MIALVSAQNQTPSKLCNQAAYQEGAAKGPHWGCNPYGRGAAGLACMHAGQSAHNFAYMQLRQQNL